MTAGAETVSGPRPEGRAGLPGWTSLVEGRTAAADRVRGTSVGRVVVRFVVTQLVAVLLLLVVGVWASAEAAEGEALADARHTTDVLATAVVEPHLRPELLTGDPAAVALLDRVFTRQRLADTGVARVKIWTAEGRILYSDERRLIGRTPRLSEEERRALRDGVTRAEVSELDRHENRFEPSGPMLEVYRAIDGPGGERLLLETYSVYDEATSRQLEIFGKFAPILVTVLLVLVAIQLPLAHRMATQLRAVQREREQLHARALDVSSEERRRIAGTLHDGIVQDVSASALVVSRAAEQLAAEDPTRPTAEALGRTAAALRRSVGSLRGQLTELYPLAEHEDRLPSAVADLAERLRVRGVDVRKRIDPDVDPPPATAALVLRTAQEALRNVTKHSGAHAVEVALVRDSGRVVLEVADDGSGFDLQGALAAPGGGHLGLRLLADLAAAAGASLSIRTAPGAGTALRLQVSAS